MVSSISPLYFVVSCGLQCNQHKVNKFFDFPLNPLGFKITAAQVYQFRRESTNDNMAGNSPGMLTKKNFSCGDTSYILERPNSQTSLRKGQNHNIMKILPS